MSKEIERDDLAALLAGHREVRIIGFRCRCGVLLDNAGPAELVESLAAHQAAVITAAGYHKVTTADESSEAYYNE